MKRFLKYVLPVVLGIALASCSPALKEIKAKSRSEKTGVFHEVKDNAAPPGGFADLTIKADVKTHLEERYLIEAEGTFHGKPLYPMVINIDGQAAVWEVEGQTEDAPEYYDENGKKNPERGKGMKYALNKRIRLAAGPHRVFFGLPGDRSFKEVSITLDEGKASVLEFKPVYNRYRYEGRRSTRGVDRIEVFLNGSSLQ